MEVKLEGFENLNKRLRALDDRTARRVVVAGLREGAKVYKQAAKRAAPRQSGGGDLRSIGSGSGAVRAPGFLARSIIYRTLTQRGSPRPTVVVGPRRAAFYGQFFERGRRGRRFPTKPWMSPLFHRYADIALGRISAELWSRLKREIDKARVSSGK